MRSNLFNILIAISCMLANVNSFSREELLSHVFLNEENDVIDQEKVRYELKRVLGSKGSKKGSSKGSKKGSSKGSKKSSKKSSKSSKKSSKSGKGDMVTFW